MERTRQRDDILRIAEELVINDGVAALTIRSVAHRSGLDEDAVLAVFPAVELLMTDLLDREFDAVRRMIIDNVERDPLGGLLSRIHRYALIAVYESALTRALYLDDPDGLSRIMRSTQGMDHAPRMGLPAAFIERMKEAGMVRDDVDSVALSSVLGAIIAGAALVSPEGGIDQSTRGLTMLLERSVDAPVTDTSAGKVAYIDYVLGR